MYMTYYRLAGIPFEKSLATNEIFRFSALKELFSRLNYLKTVKGLFLLTGMPGVGKTTALRTWVEELKADFFKIVYIQLTTVSTVEFYRQINKALGGQQYSRKSELFSSIQELIIDYATIKKQIPIIVIDEIQFLRDENLFELQLLLNFNFDSLDPAIVILCGQSFIREKLIRPNFCSINQRFRIKYEMPVLGKDETKQYIFHHLKLVKASMDIFSENAFDAIFNASAGVLRNINRLTISALMYGAAHGSDIIKEDFIYRIIGEM